MGQNARIIVAVCGAGTTATLLNLSDARTVGRLLARRDIVVAAGGKTAVMEAACQGALKAGGITIAFLPGSDPDEANDFVQIPLALGVGYHRNSLLVQATSATIAIGGEYETMTEVTAALNFHKPVATIGTWRLTKPDGHVPEAIYEASPPSDAVDWVLNSISNSTL